MVRPKSIGLWLPAVALICAAACSSGTLVDVAEPGAGAAVRRADVAPVVASTTAPSAPSTAPSATAPSTVAPSTVAPSTVAPTTTASERRPVVIGVAGDTTLTHGLADRGPFDDVLDLLQGPDLMIVNLETVVAEVGVGSPVDKEFVFRSPLPSSDQVLVVAGCGESVQHQQSSMVWPGELRSSR